MSVFAMRTPDQTRLLLGLMALLLVAIGAAGCGGEEHHLTKAQFLKRGNAICVQAKAEQVKLAKGHEKVLLGNPQVSDVLPIFLPPMQKELRRLEALDPPQGDQERVQAILDGIEWGVKDAKSDFLDLYVKRADPFVRSDEKARKYGLDACAVSSHAVIKPIYRVSYGVGKRIG